MLIYLYIYICLCQCCVQLENFSNTRVCRDYNFQQVKEGNMMSNLPFQPRFFGSFFDDSFQASLHFLSFINPSPQCIDKPKKTQDKPTSRSRNPKNIQTKNKQEKQIEPARPRVRAKSSPFSCFDWAPPGGNPCCLRQATLFGQSLCKGRSTSDFDILRI